MTENEGRPEQEEVLPDQYDPGARSITRRGPGRKELLAEQRRSKLRSRPWIIAGAVILVALLAFPIYAFVRTFTLPPREVAVRVEDSTYTRGDVVDFIRFRQRLTEEVGGQFELGTSLFEALQVIQDNEIAFKLAPRLGIAVTPDEVDLEVEFLLQMNPRDIQERETEQYQATLAERKRQFLNNVGLSEEVYWEFVRKEVFKNKVRAHIATDVPRIVPHVRLYEIRLSETADQDLQRVVRTIEGGAPVDEVAKAYSVDPAVTRTGGEVGWFPEDVHPTLDRMLFGVDEDGERLLAFGEPSPPQLDSETRQIVVYVVTEGSEAREVTDDHFEILADNALTNFLNDHRREFDLYMELNDRIYAWVNRQVAIASIRPTPTPEQGIPGLGGFGAGFQTQ